MAGIMLGEGLNILLRTMHWAEMLWFAIGDKQVAIVYSVPRCRYSGGRFDYVHGPAPTIRISLNAASVKTDHARKQRPDTSRDRRQHVVYTRNHACHDNYFWQGCANATRRKRLAGLRWAHEADQCTPRSSFWAKLFNLEITKGMSTNCEKEVPSER